MLLYLQVKQITKRRAVVQPREWYIDVPPKNVGELIALAVASEVDAYNERVQQEGILRYLTSEEIEDQSVAGRVSFQMNYNRQTAKHTAAVQNALQCYEDGIFRLFIGEEEAGPIDTPIQLCEGDTLTFVRLTMLAGRMW